MLMHESWFAVMGVAHRVEHADAASALGALQSAALFSQTLLHQESDTALSEPGMSSRSPRVTVTCVANRLGASTYAG